jgi:hypothetical protein
LVSCERVGDGKEEEGEGSKGKGEVVLDCPFGEAMVGSWVGGWRVEGELLDVFCEVGAWCFWWRFWSRVCPAKMDVKSPSQRS